LDRIPLKENIKRNNKSYCHVSLDEFYTISSLLVKKILESLEVMQFSFV